MPTEYNKLVRDRIPDIIRQHGHSCDAETMDEEAYRQALRAKLVEEATEVAAAANEHELLTELADVYEVMAALMTTYEITLAAVHTMQEQRRIKRGGFAQRICLLRTY